MNDETKLWIYLTLFGFVCFGLGALYMHINTLEETGEVSSEGQDELEIYGSLQDSESDYIGLGDSIVCWADERMVANFSVVQVGGELRPVLDRSGVVQDVDLTGMTESEFKNIVPDYVERVEVIK